MKNKKKILFVHQNFPAQYKHLSKALVDKDYDVHTLSITKCNIKGMNNHHYELTRGSSENIHTWAAEFETKMIRAEAAEKKAQELKKNGFIPNVIIGHPGWGETFFLKEVWPDAKLISYVEFYYKTKDSDIDFDRDFSEKILKRDFEKYLHFNSLKLTARNAPFLATYSTSDYLIAPTHFQKNLIPDSLRDNVEVIHDGIDTNILKPNSEVTITYNEKKFTKSDSIITYVSRSLDPYRGFHILMKSLPKILKDNPNSYVFIVGDQKNHGYGAPSPDGRSFKDMFFSDISDEIDTDRVIFFGRVPYEEFIKVIQISSVHIYLTFPFILSWSILEAMSCESIIIGSNTDPVTEVIKDNENGFLIDFFDVKALSDNVNKVLKNKDKYKRIGVNARKTIVDNFDLHKKCLPAQLDLVTKALK